MNHAIRGTVQIVSLFSFIVAASLQIAAPAQAADKDPILHALFVFDTDDERLGTHLEGNRDVLIKVFDEAFQRRPHNLQKSVFAGDQVTPDMVLAHFRDLGDKVRPEDSVLFYYGGHGATDPVKGHCLTMNRGLLERQRLLDEMTSLGCRQVVVFTDCCSVVMPLAAREAAIPEASWPAIDCLFFQHKGVTDINACQANAFSWFFYHDDVKRGGGGFTMSLAPLLCTKKDRFAEVFGSDDGFVAWDQFVKPLRQETNDRYVKMRDLFLDETPESEAQKQTQNLARSQLEQLPEIINLAERAEQKILRRTWLLGIEIGTATSPDDGAALGAVAGKVYPGTPADEAGIQKNDLIVAVDGRATRTDLQAFREIDHSITGRVVLTIKRGVAAARDVEVTLVRVKPEDKLEPK